MHTRPDILLSHFLLGMTSFHYLNYKMFSLDGEKKKTLWFISMAKCILMAC